MLEVLGKYYYIDINSITEKCKSTVDTTKAVETPKIEGDEKSEEKSGIEINLFKYETIKICLEVVLSDAEQVDEELGALAQTNLPLSFKIAFNTLLKNEIIIEEEDE